MAYTDNTAVKLYLGLTGSGDDTFITALIVRAQAMIDKMAGRTFEASSDSTRYFFRKDVDLWSGTLWFDGDLCSITSVTNGDGNAVTVSDIQTMPTNSTPYYALRINPSVGAFTAGVTDAERITVVGKWAYSTSAPADIVHATIKLAGFIYRSRENGGDTDRTVFAGNATLSPQAIPADVQAIVRGYAMAVTS